MKTVKNYWVFYVIKKKKKNVCVCVCMYEIYLISTEGYKKANVHHLILQKAGEIWPTIKDVGSGMGVKTYLI